MIEFYVRDTNKYPESLVLLSRALVANTDVLSPMIYASTASTRSSDLAGVSISLAMIRSWFVAMTSWDLRTARGCYPLASLNRTSLPSDFQYDYLFSIIVTLFDDGLPFQITQKTIEFVYSIWDIIPNDRLEHLRKTLLESGIFINLFLHWERNVRIFFSYTMAVRLLQPRKWSFSGGMPSVHFEDFVEEEEEEEEDSEEGSSEDEEDDIITIERMNSSSARLTIDDRTRSSSTHSNNTTHNSHSFEGSPELKALPRIITYDDPTSFDRFTGAANVTGVSIQIGASHSAASNSNGVTRATNTKALQQRIAPSRNSVMYSLELDNIDRLYDPSSPATPTFAGHEHPKGARRIILSKSNSSSSNLTMDGDEDDASLDDSRKSRIEAEHKSTTNNNNMPQVMFTPQATRISVQSMGSSSNVYEEGSTPSQERMSSVLRHIRRSNMIYQEKRKNDFGSSTILFDARESPKGGMENKLKDDISVQVWNEKHNEMLKDENEYGHDQRKSATQQFQQWGTDDVHYDGDANLNMTLENHPGMGGESINYLHRQKEKDELLLQRDFMWSTIKLPTEHQLVYAKDALRVYSLASRRVHIIQQEQANGKDVLVPELTFVALVADESGHGYKDATTTKKDQYVKIEEA